jgi:hypothetical protein
MAQRNTGTAEVQLHAFCTSTITGGEWLFYIIYDHAEYYLELRKRYESILTSERQEEYNEIFRK